MPPKINAPLNAAPLLVIAVKLPAVALFKKFIIPCWPAPSTAVTKFCVNLELFVIPVPSMVNLIVGLPTVIVNALAPASNTMPSTTVSAEMETPVIVDTSKVAVSENPLGGPPAVQFAAVFQSPVTGLASHVALPAKAAARC
jgi:hypothetical protein